MKAFIVAALLLLSQTAHAQERVWQQPPEVYVNNQGAVNPGLPESVGYYIWLYEQRTSKKAVYKGFTNYTDDAPLGTIVYVWLGILEYFTKFKSFDTKATTTSYYYTGTNTMAKAVVWLNSLYFTDTMTRCQGLIVGHEHIHAMGSEGHNDYAHSLMHAAPSHCRYIATQEDLPLSPSCYAEVSPVYDVYIPNIQGKQVFLKNEGNNLWSVDWASEGSGARCSNYTKVGDTVTLHEVRSMHGTYRVTLKQQGELWQLIDTTQ